jgi:hypothetical protein
MLKSLACLDRVENDDNLPMTYRAIGFYRLNGGNKNEENEQSSPDGDVFLIRRNIRKEHELGDIS